ncbi:hypothetical protein COCVIDRAFT_92424 [Bipolaris victoriae FI3]|uniref:Uncharacterized protein n=1 Tax=Bipolaris victoriae (strain FI3) TaxID=930091 RepID=W7EUL2_BIPV3|nr:hypothetical protein COCVIDRAFT_92424 [Bipolaris victoriae FI3]
MANEQEKRDVAKQPRCVQRKPGLERLGSQDDDASMPVPAKHGHIRSSTWIDTQSEPATSPNSPSAPLLLQSMHSHSAKQLGEERKKQMLEEQRVLWESTLPKSLLDHIGGFATGRHFDYVHPTGMRRSS